jgi:hypothetical protein
MLNTFSSRLWKQAENLRLGSNNTRTCEEAKKPLEMNWGQFKILVVYIAGTGLEPATSGL